MRRVFVTGASGFVGPHLVRALHGAGARVEGGGPETEPGVALDGWHAMDVLDAAAVASAVAAARPDAVIHLAGQSSAARSFEDPEGTFRVNVGGTGHVLEAVRRHAPRARVLVVSSGEVYGPLAEGARAAEDAPLAPVSPYGRSKAEAEHLALAAGRAGLDVVVARAFGHTGPGQDGRFFVPSFARQVARAEAGLAPAAVEVGNLEVTRDLSDVRDVVRAYLALLGPGVPAGVYNVCRGEGVRLADVARGLAALARVPVTLAVAASRFRPADLPWLVGDPARLARATGWGTAIPFERTLADVLEDWRVRVRG